MRVFLCTFYHRRRRGINIREADIVHMLNLLFRVILLLIYKAWSCAFMLQGTVYMHAILTSAQTETVGPSLCFMSFSATADLKLLPFNLLKALRADLLPPINL